MRQRPIEELLVKISPRFAMVNALAARAEQLIRGDLPAVETNTRNPVLVAMEELALGRLHVNTGRAGVASKKGTELREAPATDDQDAESVHAEDALVSSR
ncbi:MAG TPA: DNA-directed RNA polymerase subunit omega [bacterium]|nr:DNA-directed RNA polymerase subunit omega [bacterium]